MYAPYTLQEHYDALEKQFHRLLLIFQNQPEGESIHQLRVNIKKQMAFFGMLRALENELPLEEVQTPLNAFFKSIGRFRNLEVRQGILAEEEKKYAVSNAYSAEMKADIAEEKAWWANKNTSLSLIPFREVSNKIRASIDRMPLENIKETLGEYFYFLIEEIRQTINQEDLKEEALHDLRKLLKTVFFNLKLTDRLIVQAAIPETLYEETKAINEQLGNWHDQFITIYKLNAKRPKVDKQVLKLLKKKERIARKKLIGNFPVIYDLTSKLKQELFHLFAQDEPIVIPPRRFQEKKHQMIRNSFSQMNTLELTK